jgi:hypothetical protein
MTLYSPIAVCDGLRISGFGDVIEAFKVEVKTRML